MIFICKEAIKRNRMHKVVALSTDKIQYEPSPYENKGSYSQLWI